MLRNPTNSTFRQTIYAPPGKISHPAPDFFISLFGEFQSTGGFDNELLSTTHNVHVIREGEGTVVTPRGKHHLGPGDLLVFYPGEQVHYFDHPSQPWRYDWFFLSGRRTDEVLGQLGLSAQKPKLHCPPAAACLDSMARALQDRSAGTLSWSIEAWKFVDVLLRELPRLPNAPANPAGLAEACRQIIETRYMNPLTIDELARQFRVTRSTLFRRFVAAFEISPKGYLNEVRLQRARAMLRSPEASVKGTAYSCGFSNPYYFSKAFSKRFGICPSQWHKEKKNFAI